MCEFEKISSYKAFSSVLPIIVMVTTPAQHHRYAQQIRWVLVGSLALTRNHQKLE